MHGPLREPERGTGRDRDALDRGLRGRGQARGRHVDRLLEERAVERIRLVEERERLQAAPQQEALERNLAPRHERLHQQVLRGAAGDAHVVAAENRGDALERGDEAGGVVGPNDAAARRQGEGLEDAREGDGAGEALGVVGEPHEAEARHRHARRGEALAHLVLVARGVDRGGRARLEPEALGDRGGGLRRAVVDADDGVERVARGEARGGLRRGGGPVEVEGQQGVGSVRLEGAGALGRAHEVRAERASGVDEGLGPVGRRRQKEEHPRHRASRPTRAARLCPACSRGWRRRRGRSCPAPRPPRGALP